jgi:hypothetical protein
MFADRSLYVLSTTQLATLSFDDILLKARSNRAAPRCLNRRRVIIHGAQRVPQQTAVPIVPICTAFSNQPLRFMRVKQRLPV